MGNFYADARAAVDVEMPLISVACDKALDDLSAQIPIGLDWEERCRRAAGVRAVNDTIDQLLGRGVHGVIERLGHYRDTRLTDANLHPLPERDIERHIEMAWRSAR
jgi:hypothetical protein